jgi:integrase
MSPFVSVLEGLSAFDPRASATIVLPIFDLGSTMGTITTRKRRKGAVYTAQVRIKESGRVVYSEAKSFARRALAAEWLRRREAELDAQRARGEPLRGRRGETLGELIEWYGNEVGALTPFGRTKRAALSQLQRTGLADKVASKLSTADFIEHVQARRRGGVSPATALNDVIWLRQVLRAAQVDMASFEAASRELKTRRVVRRPKRRERRLLAGEETALLDFFKHRDARSKLPMVDIVQFALMSTRRQSEITQLRWADLRPATGTAWLDDVKHPTQKVGNRREFRMLSAAWEVVNRQPKTGERVFPYLAGSIRDAFTRACQVLGIEDLRFHDLRHEAISRLFEQGYPIHEVAQISLHESWAALKIYAQPRPEHVRERS